MDVVSYIMVYVGSALMAFNIYLYVRFERKVRSYANWSRESKVLYIPIVLLVFFLAGYLAVGIFGKPDIIISSILFGGSIFVALMLWLVRSAVEKIKESEKLEAKLLAAEEASRAKTFFLSNMSHDIRTPLNAIIGYTALAKKEETPREKKCEYVGKVEKASRQLLDIVNDILEMGRIESGKIELDPKPTDITECVFETGDLLKMQLAENNVAFSVDCDVKDKTVLCDRVLFNRVLMNLLGNAGKFTPENGSISVFLKELSCKDGVGDYEVRVKDTGIGMDPDFVKHIFTPFEREKDSTVSKTQGTGLGMAITKNIIELMAGDIKVETEKGKGTEFIISVSFPIVSDDEAGDAESVEEIRFDGRHALLVDDNAVNTEIAVLLLTQAGFAVDTAENGKEAVDKASAGGFDVVLMDVQMPVMNGYDAARTIRALKDPAASSVPIIAMTANAFRDDVETAFAAGMNAHISKPIDVSEMMRTIKRILDEKKTTEEENGRQ